MTSFVAVTQDSHTDIEAGVKGMLTRNEMKRREVTLNEFSFLIYGRELSKTLYYTHYITKKKQKRNVLKLNFSY